jgi:hypothetical protein
MSVGLDETQNQNDYAGEVQQQFTLLFAKCIIQTQPSQLCCNYFRLCNVHQPTNVK